MFFIDDALVTSASDLTTASNCEYEFLRKLDSKLGWNTDPLPADDAMLELAAQLGDLHERDLLARYVDEHGDGVVQFDRPENMQASTLREMAASTRAALESGARVVFQGVFFDESDPQLPFIGFADFLVCQADGRYRVVDTKLARHVKTSALMQLAAYHEQLSKWGIAVDDTVELILGNHTVEAATIDDIAPVFRVQRSRMHDLIAQHRANGTAVQWGDDTLRIDGNCKFCVPAIAEHRDLLYVANLRRTQRAKLRSAGILTIDDLAATPVRAADCDVPESTYATLQQQAALQVRALAEGNEIPPFEIVTVAPIGGLPQPSPGDVFFDFEGDPMFLERQPDGRPMWGLDYLFGWVDADGKFDKLWAHSPADEKQALIDFLAFVEQRRQHWPDSHIYHYASYEKTHLLSIAARHGVGEAAVDRLLRENVLIDLLPIVRKSIRVGSPSYSIKKLEPLYMSDEARAGVSNAADSIIEYRRATALREAGDLIGAQQVLDDIEQYNAYDCVSTLELRNWLLRLPGVDRTLNSIDTVRENEPFTESPLAATLRERADRIIESAAGSDEALERGRAFELAAAALDYHARERKSFWQAHFLRLEQTSDLWDDNRDVFTIDHVTAGPWTEHDDEKMSRELRLEGTWAPGSSNARAGAKPYALYESDNWPYMPELPQSSSYRLAHPATIVEISDDRTVVTLEEKALAGETWDQLPTFLAPAPPPDSQILADAIAPWAGALERAGDSGLTGDPAWSLLTRTSMNCAPRADINATDSAVIETLVGMTHGFVAVQGPPGTGKTYLAGDVIATLAQRGWSIGVVAQSHKVVENALQSVVRAGMPVDRIRKSMQNGVPAAKQPFRITGKQIGPWLAKHADEGCVLGGTAWTFSNRNYVGEGQLDLLVIDEAGQFSLANMIAASTSAKRILLVGDPQQLPQVSQAVHPAPVDGSALGHLSGSQAVLPERFGYFLEQSRRMDAAVTAAVSNLAYAGELGSHPNTIGRSLGAVRPGLTPIALKHFGNSTHSVEEAAEVVRIAEQHLGQPWVAKVGEPAVALAPEDIIVITPYNAQVQVIREVLDEAGLTGVDVGTADKYQGREAVISIVSLAASDANEVPRGIDFLLSPNRLNVAISRAMWAAYLIHSPGLLDHLPHTIEGMANLSRFVTLTQGDQGNVDYEEER